MATVIVDLSRTNHVNSTFIFLTALLVWRM